MLSPVEVCDKQDKQLYVHVSFIVTTRRNKSRFADSVLRVHVVGDVSAKIDQHTILVSNTD